MRKTLSLLILLSSVFTLSAREKISINEGWSFSKSISTGAAVDQFARYGGRVEKVNLPHTWNASDFMSTEGYYRGYGSYPGQSRSLHHTRGKGFSSSLKVPAQRPLSL